MRVVDTSAWIEWLLDSSAGKAVEAELPDDDEWIVPTVVQLELMKWLSRELGKDAANATIAFSRTCVTAILDTPIAIDAALLSQANKLSTADAVIYATAKAYNADLLTCDADFNALDGVVYVAKTKI